jgi:hypothetical protein
MTSPIAHVAVCVKFSLMELLDGLVMMYHISAHKQLGKVSEG